MNPSDTGVVAITGAAGNLGQATARAFTRGGARVALLDRRIDRLQQLAAELPGPGGARAFAVDLMDPDAINATLAEVRQQLGPIRVLANIAGGFRMGTRVHETPDQDWELMLNLNLRSMFYCSRAAIPQMLELGGGRIISISARAAREGKGSMGPYCASKAGVITLTESLAAEYKFDGITANCILPGTIDTPENREAMPTAKHENWVAPEDIAAVIAFLASEQAHAVTGAAIPVYGRS